MGGLWLDIRYAIRSLVGNRMFALAAIISLCFGIGLNTAIFSLVNAVLLRPFPYRDPDRLVIIWGTKSFDVRRGMRSDQVDALRKQTGTFDDIAAFQINPFPFALGSDQSETVHGAIVGPGTFALLGVGPLKGRTFSQAGAKSEEEQTVILSYGLWRSHFAGDEEILGKTIDLNKTPYLVLGIMPRGFFFPDQSAQLWVPLTKATDLLDQVQAVARLRPGASLERAQAVLDATAKPEAEESTKPEPQSLPGVFPIYRVVVAKYESALLTLLAATGLLVLIGCANVSNLLLARGVGREKEFAIRCSLGASRWKVFRQLLVENTLLSLSAGILGVACAWQGLALLKLFRLTDIPHLDTAGVDLHVLLFALVISMLTSLISGLAPGWKFSRDSIYARLQSGTLSTKPRHEGALRELLVTIEVAAAMVLLVGASLLTNSFVRLVRADWGFNQQNLLLVDAPLPRQLALVPDRPAQYGNEVLDRLSRVPDVVSSAMTYGVPIDYGYRSPSFSEGGQMVKWGADTWDVGPDYFRTMQIPVIRGREFQQADNDHSPPVVVVSKAFADKLWPGKDPVGRFIQMLRLRKDLTERARNDPRMSLPHEIMERPESWQSDGAPSEVVGEVGNVRAFGLDVIPEPDLYLDYRQEKSPCCSEKFVIRTAGDPGKLIPIIKDQTLGAEKSLSMVRVTLMSDLVSESIGGRGSNKLLLVISALFGSLSLLLAVLGIYGVVSFGVAQRTREIGVRRALGGGDGAIILMVLRQMLPPVLVGILLGVAGVIGEAELIKGLLFGVSATDPLMLGGTALSLVLVAGAACAPPTLRAIRINPSDALRWE